MVVKTKAPTGYSKMEMSWSSWITNYMHVVRFYVWIEQIRALCGHAIWMFSSLDRNPFIDSGKHMGSYFDERC